MVRQRFKPFQKAKDAKEFWDNAEEPQEGLVPLFNSPFYATPDTPADPMDCNRYPDSPYCGGNPLTSNFAPSIEITLVRDECNLGIQFDGSFAFIKFPPVQIVYRNPNCALPPPPPPPPNTDYSEYADIPESQYESDLWLVVPTKIYHYYSYAELNAWDALTVDFSLKEVKGVIGETPIEVTVSVKYQYQRTGLNLRQTISNAMAEGDYPGLSSHLASWLGEGGNVSGSPGDDDSLWNLNFEYEAYSSWNGIGTAAYWTSNNGYHQGRDGLYSNPHYGYVSFIGARYSEFIQDPSRPFNSRRTSLHPNRHLRKIIKL